MNIALAIMYLYPDANPMRDFTVQDNGPEPVLFPGAEEKGLVRYEIKQPEDGEEPTENLHYRFGIDYNLLTKDEDYYLVERGPFIAYWGLEEPQPTDAELVAAWEAYHEAEANKPPKRTEIEQVREELVQTQIALTDTYEQLLSSQNEATSAQLALVDLYELVLPLIGGDV
ncbi:XkdW family protein [Paenibacillus pedocola]|uniref:XkdW family protein n=1 Tax=Paenibacillus pedocola TaxID=3242193 RepID=UPI0028773C21|nr:XkdW family protein [Paenibacillus typhae]